MGVVYKAHDPVLDRLVAIKVMSSDIGDDPKLRQRFSQEARAAARLNHRNIVTIYELEEASDEICIVMELLEGVDLATVIKQQADLPLATRVDIMAQVCDGLGYAHRADIVHRDVKPANLHVASDGVVKILDFGIARLSSSHMTKTGGLVGTPNYMSPEQITGGVVDARSDIFAAGAVLYELLSGVRPFEADSVTAVLFKIVQGPHEPLGNRVPSLPDTLVDLVERALAKNPDARPATAQEMRTGLLAIANALKTPDDSDTTTVILSMTANGTLQPVSPGQGSVAPGSSSGSESEAKLASLAIDRGRELRRSGDLGGAMKVLRSVLEIAPGNMEAAEQVAELEEEIAAKLAVSPARAQAPAAPRVVARPPTHRPVQPSPRAPAASGNRRTVWLVAAAVVLLAVSIGAVLLVRARRAREQAPQTPIAVATPPPAPASPATDVTPAPAAAADPAAVTPSPPDPLSTVAAPNTPASAAPRTAPRRRTEPARPVPAAPAPEPAPEPPPPAPIALPSATIVVPPPPAAAPAPPTVVVYYFRGGGRFLGIFGRKRAADYSKDACEGVMTLLSDGLRFKTTKPCQDAKANEVKLFTFKTMKKFSLEDERLRIEADDRNWDFVGSPEALARIDQHIKAAKGKP